MTETMLSADHQAVATLWMQQVQRSDAPEPLRANVIADVCVVGGGYTGLWTALQLKERQPELEVRVVEAGRCGSGASGANGGFAMTWWSKFGTLRKLFGEQEAVLIGRLSEEVVQSIGSYSTTHGLDAHFSQAGWLWAATNPSQVDSWRDTVAQLADAHQAPYALLSAPETHRFTGSEQHLGGVYEAGVATVHPGRLVEGLRRRALAIGVRIHENSPMRALDRVGTATDVVTPAGRVRATSVVLATNAALGSLAEVRRHLVVVGSDVIASAPCPDRLADTGFASGLAVSDSRRLVHYYRATDDGRLVFGKGGGGLAFRGRADAFASGPNGRHDAVVRHFHRVLPRLRDVPITHRWSGHVDYSVDGLPFAGRLTSNPGVSYMTGFSGNGVAPAYLAGQVLASLALEADDDWSRLPLVRKPTKLLPPEPFRFVGGSVVRAAMQRQEKVQDAGGRVGVPTRLITSLDPTSFVG